MEVSFNSWQEPLLALSHNSSINIQSHLSLCCVLRKGTQFTFPSAPTIYIIITPLVTANRVTEASKQDSPQTEMVLSP